MLLKIAGKRFLLIGGVILISIGAWIALRTTEVQNKEEKLQVTATFFPLADIARTIGQDEVRVSQIVSDGAEPHEYEPSAQDIAKILTSDIFLFDGGSVDAWAEKLVEEANKKGVHVVRVGDSNGENTHPWLDPHYMENVTNMLRGVYSDKDHVHEKIYNKRAEELLQTLQMLDVDFLQMAKVCIRKDIFVIHPAFSAWQERYAFAMHALEGLSEHAEPSIADIALFVENAKEKQATTIFFESPDTELLAKTVAQEIGIATNMLSPLEGRTVEEIAQQATYVTLMKKNILALTHALACQK